MRSFKHDFIMKSLMKIILLSLIGGSAGGISALIASLLTNIFSPHSLFILILMLSIIYSMSGLAIAYTLYLFLQLKKSKLLIAGLVGGSLFGIFVGFGTFGYYIAFIPLIVCLGIAVGGKNIIRVALGAFMGVVSGNILVTLIIIVMYSTNKSLIASSPFTEYAGILMISFVFYWLNFGTLLAVKRNK